MGSITIRNLPDEIHKNLKRLAIQNNRSAEAEARNILAAAVNRELSGGLGTLIRQTWGSNIGGELCVKRSSQPARKGDSE